MLYFFLGLLDSENISVAEFYFTATLFDVI